MTIAEHRPNDALERLERLVANLEGLLPAAVAAPRAAVNPDGSPGNVAAGELIEAAWGNAVANTIAGLPRGILQRLQTSSDVGGFGGTEFIINGLNLAVPASPTSRLHEVKFGLHILQTSAPSINSAIYVSLRQGTTTAGTLIGTIYEPFIDNSSPYGRYFIGTFYPTGLLPGATYCLTTSGDGTGRYTVRAGSWSALYDVT